jgi:CheY-like chemotaxis protein
MASILVVEDETAMNDLIRAELEAEGHIVRQAHDGPTALQLVRE